MLYVRLWYAIICYNMLLVGNQKPMDGSGGGFIHSPRLVRYVRSVLVEKEWLCLVRRLDLDRAARQARDVLSDFPQKEKRGKRKERRDNKRDNSTPPK